MKGIRRTLEMNAMHLIQSNKVDSRCMNGKLRLHHEEDEEDGRKETPSQRTQRVEVKRTREKRDGNEM